jgi:hypothetical protein
VNEYAHTRSRTPEQLYRSQARTRDVSPTYERGTSTDYREIDRWDGGVGWIAHPAEDGRRASHAVRTDEGVWLFDPLDAPGIDDLLAEFGPVVGVAVLADYHARDAGRFARRHDVPVTVPSWLRRVPNRLDAPLRRTSGPIAGFELRHLRPLYAWRESLAYRERDRTLYVPDYLSTHPKFTVGTERLGLPSLSRLSPSRGRFDGIDPQRVLVGHGEGVFEGAAGVLSETLDGARIRLPLALANLPAELRAMLGALVE